MMITEKIMAIVLAALAWINSFFGISFAKPVRVDMDQFELVWAYQYK